MRLDVIGTNAPARRLYERHGFRLTGRETVRQRDGQIELQMERPI
jgi:ribosomal protein S18 acetylase RimI-like enzyme